MNIHITSNIAAVTGDVIVPITPEMAPFAENEVLSSLTSLADGPQNRLLADLDATAGETMFAYAGEKRLIFIGLGKRNGLGSLYRTFRAFSKKYGKKLQDNPCLFLHDGLGNPSVIAEAATDGLLTGSYDTGLYVSERRERGPLAGDDARLTMCTAADHSADVLRCADRGAVMASVCMRMMDLVNTPGNRKKPLDLVRWARESGNTWGYSVEVFDLERIHAEGMLALEAVNRGSEHPAVCIVMRYNPEGSAGTSGAGEVRAESGAGKATGVGTEADPAKATTVGLVGKGVLYDTGGLSIKPTSSMQFMKSDMAGAATVLGTVEAAARLGLKTPITAVIPVTDNLVDSRSIKPGDVIGSYAGKTIEVIDTDAEGRLILADALAWLTKNSTPDHIVDVATLTGDAIRALGTGAAALFSNNDRLAGLLSDAGTEVGERLWRMPLFDDYLDDLRSDVADLRNLGTKPVGGAITAAKFLEQFINGHTSWAHLDVAGTAFGDTEFGKQKNATGFGLRLLVKFLESVSSDESVDESVDKH